MTTALIYDSYCLQHETGHHPENPARFSVILEALENGLRPRFLTVVGLDRWAGNLLFCSIRVPHALLPQRRISATALQSLMQYGFPGNVRELRNLIERAYILSTQDEIGPENFPVAPASDVPVAVNNNGHKDSGHLPSPESPQQSFDLTAFLEKTEKELILKTLASTGGAQAEAARRMGLSRSALAYKLTKYGIKPASE